MHKSRIRRALRRAIWKSLWRFKFYWAHLDEPLNTWLYDMWLDAND